MHPNLYPMLIFKPISKEYNACKLNLLFKREKIIYIKNGNNIDNFLFGIKIEIQRDIFAHNIPNKKVRNNCKIKNKLLLFIP